MRQFVALYFCKYTSTVFIHATGIVIYSGNPRRHPRHLSTSDSEVWIYDFVSERRVGIKGSKNSCNINISHAFICTVVEHLGFVFFFENISTFGGAAPFCTALRNQRAFALGIEEQFLTSLTLKDWKLHFPVFREDIHHKSMSILWAFY